MKSKEVLNLLQITRPTLSKYLSLGWIEGKKLKNGLYDYSYESIQKFLNKNINRKIIIYARVSTSNQKKDLENQIEFLKQYCFSKGYKIDCIYKDISSGINYDNRKEFFKLLEEIIDNKVEKVIITYKDRLSRVGFSLFVNLFKKFGTEIEVISEVGNTKMDSEEIFEEIITLIHSFAMKMYSKRKGKNSFLIEEEK
jgi:predicted site-specific integrase-resolvase